MSTMFGKTLTRTYVNLPQWFCDEIQNYLSDGINPGGTVASMLTNEPWVTVVSKVQEQDVCELRNMMLFIYNRMPGGSFGSDENFSEFLASGGVKDAASLPCLESAFKLEEDEDDGVVTERKIEFGNSTYGDVGVVVYITESENCEQALEMFEAALEDDGSIKMDLHGYDGKIGEMIVYVNKDRLTVENVDY